MVGLFINFVSFILEIFFYLFKRLLKGNKYFVKKKKLFSFSFCNLFILMLEYLFIFYFHIFFLFSFM